jgi:hypothetical protein
MRVVCGALVFTNEQGPRRKVEASARLDLALGRSKSFDSRHGQQSAHADSGDISIFRLGDTSRSYLLACLDSDLTVMVSWEHWVANCCVA